MDKLTTALAPIFAAGFAVQQLLEIITSFFDLDTKEVFRKFKKPILGSIALVVGFAIAFSTDALHVLTTLLTQTITDASGKTNVVVPQINRFLEAFVTGLIISAGTEGINSIMKFIKYSKEDKKNEAAAKLPDGAAAGGQPAVPAAPNLTPTPEALKKMDFK
jgi:hypothetical protein